jgi:hypothetical protein
MPSAAPRLHDDEGLRHQRGDALEVVADAELRQHEQPAPRQRGSELEARVGAR